MKRVIGILFLFIGIGCFFYPNIATHIQSEKTNNYIKYYEKSLVHKEKDGAYKKAVAYNHRIYKEHQKGFKDPWSYEQNPYHVQGWNRKDFGYISIPEMDLKLPLYLGASDSHLAKGAAVLGQTSLPVGGENTNSVIAGHRGYSGIPYFREIGRLKTGDKVVIRNPWEKLTYLVEQIQIIDPNDIDKVKIQPGRDMVTLITCHPYRGHGKYRYVVYCVRSNTKMKMKKNEMSEKSASRKIEEERRFRQLCGAALIVMCTLEFVSIFRRREGSEKI